MEELQTQEILSKMEMMKQIVMGFTNVINKENEALKNNDVKMVKSLYEQKLKTVAAYRSLSAFFIKNRSSISAVETPLKEELKELSKELDNGLKTNELLLKTRMEAGKRVMDTIVNIAKVTNNSNASSYGSHGNYTLLGNNYNALAFNRTL